jgi:hypothetical protein
MSANGHKAATTVDLVRDEYNRRVLVTGTLEDASRVWGREVVLNVAKLAALSAIADRYPSTRLRSAIRDVVAITEADL